MLALKGHAHGYPRDCLKKPIKIIKLTPLIFITFFLLIHLIFIFKHVSLLHGLNKGDMIVFSVTVIVAHTRILQNQDMRFLLFHGLGFCYILQQGACQIEALLQIMVYLFVII
jgi:hypothetical protein